MDFVLQKSVELGVASVTPLWTKRSQVRLSGERLDRRIHHWRGIIRSACEQSGRVVVPRLGECAPLSDWLTSAECREAQHRLVLDPAAPVHLKQLDPATRVSVLIGPEGGLGEDEITRATSHGFLRIGLGPRTLRTETAALAILTALQTLWGDLSA
jgi:16S rRNA (uracil1498-N3)-methyltransferase